MSLNHGKQTAPTPSPVGTELLATAHDVKCRWDGCGIPLPSTSIRAIHVHLRQHHFNDFERLWSGQDRRHRSRCLWEGCEYQSDMLFSSTAKHICTRHLKVLTVKCKKCGEGSVGG
ncbi:hypothetical protein B0H21DRAFT_759051 [Amylocystis lapponica]|nr:hypothetical protein B0H21DRAFT_759051 [Amylocystis lapponica]